MKIGYRIDSQGFLVEDVLEGGGEIPDVETPCPDGFYKPKWDGLKWMEGLTQGEIDAIKNQPQSPSMESRVSSLEDAITVLMGL